MISFGLNLWLYLQIHVFFLESLKAIEKKKTK